MHGRWLLNARRRRIFSRSTCRVDFYAHFRRVSLYGPENPKAEAVVGKLFLSRVVDGVHGLYRSESRVSCCVPLGFRDGCCKIGR